MKDIVDEIEKQLAASQDALADERHDQTGENEIDWPEDSETLNAEKWEEFNWKDQYGGLLDNDIEYLIGPSLYQNHYWSQGVLFFYEYYEDDTDYDDIDNYNSVDNAEELALDMYFQEEYIGRLSSVNFGKEIGKYCN